MTHVHGGRGRRAVHMRGQRNQRDWTGVSQGGGANRETAGGRRRNAVQLHTAANHGGLAPDRKRLPPWLALLAALVLPLVGLFGGQAGAATPLAQTPPSTAPAGPATAADLEQQGLSKFAQGDKAGAIDALNQGLMLAQAAGDSATQASILGDLGVIFSNLGRYPQALDDYQQALTIRTAANDTRNVALLHANIGIVYLNQGNYADALNAFQQALSLQNSLHDTVAAGRTLNDVGAVYLRQSQFARALQTFQLALSNQQATGDTADQGNVLNNLAVTYSTLGQYSQALGDYQQALQLAQSSGDQAGAEETLNNIGLLYHSEGQDAQALTELQQALTGAETLGQRTDEGQILDSLGTVYSSSGQPDQALSVLQMALGIEQETGDRPDQDVTLTSIARAYLTLGQPGTPSANQTPSTPCFLSGTAANGPALDARSAAEQALSIACALDDYAAEGAALDVLAQISEQAGSLDQALAFENQGIAAQENVRAGARLEDLKTGLAAQNAAAYQRSVLLLLKLGRDAEAFDMAERARARGFLDQLGNASLGVGSHADPQLVAQEQSLLDAISSLDGQIRQEQALPAAQQDAGLLQSLQSDLSTKQQAYEDGLTQLQVSDPESASLISIAPLTLVGVQKLLDGQTSLLSYFVTADETVAFIVTAGALQVVELPVKQTDLGMAVGTFRSFASTDANAAPDASLQQLYSWLVAPLQSQVTTPLVGVIPDGLLVDLPFAALTPDGQSYFGDQHTLFELPSASVLPFIQAKRKGQDATALVVADSAPTGFPALQHADQEAQSIASLFGTQPLLDSAATETAVAAQAGQFNVLHIAAHGELNSVAPLFSRLVLASDGQSDGSLGVQQVYGLNLAQTDLVVLSACQTQLGGPGAGDDFVSLNRAFIYAGSPSVIASLWSVDDQATSVLMTAFYQHLTAGMSKAAALQAAQADTRTQFPNPYYWAAFVLTGDPGA
jgi:CHAT domain-containing protein/tetratricopeptide (TPR) repeat protein